MQTAFPRAIESGGRWMWIFPLCNAGFWIFDEIQRGPNAHVAEFFLFPNKPGVGGIELLLITLPLVASSFYSVGISIASRAPRGRGSPE